MRVKEPKQTVGVADGLNFDVDIEDDVVEKVVPEPKVVSKEEAQPFKNTDNIPKKKREKKNPGGRPTNKEKGLVSRKQYTLTLKEETYKTFLEEAQKEEISFAKFVERAGLEYIDNHK